MKTERPKSSKVESARNHGLFIGSLVVRLANRPLFSMAYIENPDDLLGLLDAEDDSMRFEEKLAERVLKVFVFSGEGATLGHRLQCIDLPIKAAEPFCGVPR